MNYEKGPFLWKSNKNLRAKLRNSVADLRWYAVRLGHINGLKAMNKSNSLELLQAYSESGGKLNNDLKQILNWYEKIKNATPQNANRLFYDCWRFVHDFDEKLHIYDY